MDKTVFRFTCKHLGFTGGQAGTTLPPRPWLATSYLTVVDQSLQAPRQRRYLAVRCGLDKRAFDKKTGWTPL